MTRLDPRLHAYRPDLADARLRGQVESRQFGTPHIRQVTEPVIPVHKQPRFDSMQLTQALLGETVSVFDEVEGWAWVQLTRDGYVGYVNSNGLARDIEQPTHRVAVPATFSFPEPNLKAQPVVTIPMNGAVTITGSADRFARLSNGRFVFSAHLKLLHVPEPDFVAIAEMFRHVPYFWGGKSVHGLDCSGLLQLSLEAAGISALRDSDMQEQTLGKPLLVNDLDTLRRGDLVFWSGHVGIMTDESTLLHANGHHMMVVAEPLQVAVKRIAASYGQITSIRRFQ